MMFSYSKRLALLLTVCGTLLNTSPLLAAEGDAATKQSSKSSWFKPWTWGKKQKTPERYLEKVKKRLTTLNMLDDEITKKIRNHKGSLKEIEIALQQMKKVSDDATARGANPSELLTLLQNKGTQERKQIDAKLLASKEKWAAFDLRLGDIKERLEEDQRALESGKSDVDFKKVERDLKKADNIIKTTKGYTRRLKETARKWWSKMPSLRRKTSTQPAAAETNPVTELFIVSPELLKELETYKQTELSSSPVSQTPATSRRSSITDEVD